jgi:zinc transporter ZupT
VLAVFVAALATALATGLGALPLLAAGRVSQARLGLANALAAGCMAGASLGLLWEGAHRGFGRTVAGAALGGVAIALVLRVIGADRRFHLGALRGADALRALTIVGVMTAHSFAEGIGVGVAFGGGEELGLVIALAIAVHNIPEGLAISLVLVPRGVGVGRAAWWSIFSSLPQPLMAVPAFLFVEAFRPLLPAGLGFAAGAMLWMVAADLVPDALETSPPTQVAGTLLLGASAMVALQVALGV